MGAVTPGQPNIPIYGGTNIQQTIVEQYQQADVQKVLDILDLAESNIVDATTNYAVVGTPVNADISVPADSTMVPLAVAFGTTGKSVNYQARLFRLANGVTMPVHGFTIGFPGAAGTNVFCEMRDASAVCRGSVLYNPYRTPQVGLRATGLQVDGVGVAGQVFMSARVLILAGNPFNARVPVA